MAWRQSILSPIGVDIGAHSLKAVQLRRTANGVSVLASLSLPRVKPGVALDAMEIERLRGVLDRRGFIGVDVVLSVPTANFLSAILELPARGPGVPVEQIAVAEFARVNKLEPASVCMATWELPPSARASRATYMMAVGAPTDALNGHVDIVEAGGLNVVAIEEPYSAAARGALHGSSALSGMMAVIDLGWDAARLSILHGATVAYTRKLADAGLAKLVQSAIDDIGSDFASVEQDLWQLDPNEADPQLQDLLSGYIASMLREVGQALGYADHQYPDATMNAALICGGGATLPGLAERFEQTLRVPVRVAGSGVAPAAVPALGLALWEARR